MAHNFTHTGKVAESGRGGGGGPVGGGGLEGRILRKICICYKLWCGMECCMMWNQCLWPGWTTVLVKWWRTVWWRRACGVKLQCGVSGRFSQSVWPVWIYKVMCSVQSRLPFLYYVVFSVMSLQYSLYVSSRDSGISVYSVAVAVSVSVASAQLHSK